MLLHLPVLLFPYQHAIKKRDKSVITRQLTWARHILVKLLSISQESRDRDCQRNPTLYKRFTFVAPFSGQMSQLKRVQGVLEKGTSGYRIA